jgi:primary-amine oxidase
MGLSSPTILALGVSVRLDLTGRNWDSWGATEWYSLGVSYENADAFRTAVFSKGYTKPPPNVDGNWTSTNKQGDPLPLDDLPPPTLVSQGSQRFKLDAKENYVTWMDLAFYFSIPHDQGLALYDI